jgi:hypothetical protein
MALLAINQARLDHRVDGARSRRADLLGFLLFKVYNGLRGFRLPLDEALEVPPCSQPCGSE